MTHVGRLSVNSLHSHLVLLCYHRNERDCPWCGCSIWQIRCGRDCVDEINSVEALTLTMFGAGGFLALSL